jgi:hypothetical protein
MDVIMGVHRFLYLPVCSIFCPILSRVNRVLLRWLLECGSQRNNFFKIISAIAELLTETNIMHYKYNETYPHNTFVAPGASGCRSDMKNNQKSNLYWGLQHEVVLFNIRYMFLAVISELLLLENHDSKYLSISNLLWGTRLHVTTLTFWVPTNPYW